MTKAGIYFRFTGPTGWPEFREGGRIIFHGPRREELIISGTLITGDGSTEEVEHWKRLLFQRTVEVVKKTASHPDLKITRDLESDSRVSEFECWTLLAETIQGGTIYYQSVVCHQRGVVLVTFEASKSQESEAAYDGFLRSIQHT